MPYPWGREDTELLQTVRTLATLRREHACLADGDFRIVAHTPTTIAYERRRDDDRLLIVANAGNLSYIIPRPYIDDMKQIPLPGQTPLRNTTVPPYTAVIFKTDIAVIEKPCKEVQP
jgi:hypothetical protein